MLGQDLANDPNWLPLFLAFTGSLILFAIWVLELLPGRHGPVCPRWVNISLTMLIAAILVVDAERLVPRAEPASATSVWRFLVVCFTLAAVWWQGWLVRQVDTAKTRWRRPAMAILMLLFLVMAGWSSRRFYIAATPVSDLDRVFATLAGHQVPSQRYVGVTDAGTELPLLRWREVSGGERQTVETLMDQMLGETPSAIQREAPDSRSNCHGWVFTRGRFLLAGESVEQILSDNRYSIVTEPQANDLVIYRDATGGIVHTGLVVGILADNSAIVESKWSVGGRYLHAPEQQPYSSRFAYYRSSRSSHAVKIRFQNRAAVAEQPRCWPPNRPRM